MNNEYRASKYYKTDKETFIKSGKLRVQYG